jgi:UDP-N-acetylglucosamine--N-acetylmuramyl-(pentapeptide) pyrophosphoryl-undecaprenol N-acetylglucosamine transferase
MLVDANGAEMIIERELSGERLESLLSVYMSDREKLRAMGRNALRMGRADAARTIAEHLEDLAGDR